MVEVAVGSACRTQPIVLSDLTRPAGDRLRGRLPQTPSTDPAFCFLCGGLYDIASCYGVTESALFTNLFGALGG